VSGAVVVALTTAVAAQQAINFRTGAANPQKDRNIRGSNLMGGNDDHSDE